MIKIVLMIKIDEVDGSCIDDDGRWMSCIIVMVIVLMNVNDGDE